MSHLQASSNKSVIHDKKIHSLIVCPSSVVGHWMNEIKRIDPDCAFLIPLRYIGKGRRQEWKNKIQTSNLIITRYVREQKSANDLH